MDSRWRTRRSPVIGQPVLSSGIPAWMKVAFSEWIDVAIDAFQQYGRVQLALVAEFDMRTQQRSPLAPTLGGAYVSYILKQRDEDDLSLDFAEFLLAQASDLDMEGLALRLEDILEQAGSEWRVTTRDGYWALEKRVPEGVQTAVEELVAKSGSAGLLLNEAWHAAFGRDPDPELAYSKAIKAVEEAAVSVVIPKDATATLGKVANAMRDQNDWRLSLSDDVRNPSADVVYKMVRALWSGQEGRHGGNGHRAPTQEEGEEAVMLAVPLVQWFRAGSVVRRP
jgi:hypothetical protein